MRDLTRNWNNLNKFGEFAISIAGFMASFYSCTPHLAICKPVIIMFITGCSAGLSHVNGVCRSSAKTWNFNPSPKSHIYIYSDFKFGVGDYATEVTSPDKAGFYPMSGWDVTWGQHIRVLWFIAHTREPIFAHYSSKDAVWCKEDPFGDKKYVFFKLGGVLP